MLIIGAKGCAKDLLQIIHVNGYDEDVRFYDDISDDVPDLIYNRFPVIRSMTEAARLFLKDPSYCLGVGNPKSRKELYDKMNAAGGKIRTVISKDARVGHFDTVIGEGVIVSAGVQITNNVSIGDGTLINLNCTISHDVTIGAFCELRPGVHITGHVKTGSFCNIGTGAVILPGVVLGDYVTVGAGAVVTKNVGNAVTVIGVPAKPFRKK
jgi:sugar O-acyltransferase (sialic acid O-acetyltransferase NeuD family)